jgi:hypothetical protein
MTPSDKDITGDYVETYIAGRPKAASVSLDFAGLLA